MRRARSASFITKVVAIAALGFAIRLALLVAVMDHHEYGFDATWYHVVANNLADGHGFAVADIAFPGGFTAPFDSPTPTALFPPAYPAVLSLASLVGLDTLVAHQLVAVTIGSITIVLVGLLGRAVAGPGAGVVAAAVFALHPMLVSADVSMMSESLFLLVLTGAMLLSYRAADSGSLATWLALGAVLGVASLTRSEGPAYAAVMIAVTALGARRATGSWKPAGARALASVAVAALVVCPWIVRNAIQVDGTVGLATNVGATFAGANCESSYYGDRLGFWDIHCLDFDRWRETGASEPEFFAELRREATAYARDHVGRLPVVAAARVGRATSLYRPAQEVDLMSNEGRHRPVQLAGTAFAYVVFAAAIAGFMLLAHRRVWIAPLLVPIALVLVSAMAVYGSTRFRLPAEPSLAVAAAVGACALAGRVRVLGGC